ncbi:acyl carrier protein [Micromonospora sp. LOL_015]|uniref:acyl carrier protein n=1 Tax=Micromonospora sp. LOL_015 TaxID=3345416 RepID=UPI003A883FFF
MPRIERTAVQADLDRYITGNFLGDAATAQLAADTPLLEWGVLNSLNLLQLITHIKETFGVVVPRSTSPAAISRT